MVLKCEDVWGEISNYLEEDLDPAMKLAMDEHFAQCRQCTSILNGARNVVELYGDEKMFGLPAGFSQRMHERLADEIEGKKGSRLGWFLGLAATGAIAAMALFATLHDRSVPQPRAQMSQPARRLPERLVAVVDGGKLFHVPGCPFMHGKYRMVTPEEAVREGYTPCDRCMYDSLRSAGKTDADFEGEESASGATEVK